MIEIWSNLVKNDKIIAITELIIKYMQEERNAEWVWYVKIQSQLMWHATAVSLISRCNSICGYFQFLKYLCFW